MWKYGTKKKNCRLSLHSVLGISWTHPGSNRVCTYPPYCYTTLTNNFQSLALPMSSPNIIQNFQVNTKEKNNKKKTPPRTMRLLQTRHIQWTQHQSDASSSLALSIETEMLKIKTQSKEPFDACTFRCMPQYHLTQAPNSEPHS